MRNRCRLTTLYLLSISSLLLLSACGETHSSTTSMLIITEKGQCGNQQWIKAYDPNNQSSAETFKLMVEQELNWSLIEVDREYFTTYSRKGNKPWILNQIEYPKEPMKPL
ncbi:hypothetical protein BEP19_12250 [Ammoniphilus oxalaticus]|uniref:Lipoprotein n=1 Tax=Ammoniphilus oxalaticus TaxID=66863 RepID=A0A419SGU7_9BACL|nr:hypothetical protein [Ammoniphilus oxalaticus]RKD22996.1 hypothetical protein BEP19_12250 [Ammoniphilus oxalaticus]